MKDSIKEGELRYKNLVNHKTLGVCYVSDIGGDRVGVVSVNDESVFNENATYFDISPIPISKEVLEKCGFEYNNGFWRHGGFLLFESPDGLLLQVANQIVSYRPILSVHQLMNLFYSLSGKELEITL